MDTVTQAVLGAVCGHVVAGKKLGPKALLIGAVSGVVPDLDVLIKFPDDALSGILYHRHFTHSLAFIPFGGAVSALPFLTTSKGRAQARAVYLAALAGFASHAPLDLCTSWGTQFFWPFTNARLTTDLIGIVDPLFTGPLLLGVLGAIGFSVLRRFRETKWTLRPAQWALGLSLIYLLGFCGFQNFRARDAQERLAASRGHLIEYGRVMPVLGTNIVWNSAYRFQGVNYFDAIRIPWFGAARIDVGRSEPLPSTPTFPTHLPEERRKRLLRDFEVWAWFTDGFFGRVPTLELEGDRIALADYRYSGGDSDTAPPGRVLILNLGPDSKVSSFRWGSSGRSVAQRITTLRRLLWGDDFVEPL